MRLRLACLATLGIAGLAAAQDPVAPPPRLVQVEPAPLPPLGYYRRSAYEVWQDLAVDRQGYWRARVVLTPYGAYYRYNGQPFPWTTTQQYNFIPYMPYTND